jgi:glycerol-3-phosphate O-acyltransferase / dihydroxyacetone phosphate acyltransferase
MWLLPFFSPISRLAVRTYYRLRIDGPPVPAAGPVLLVANHPNSLLDPAIVVAVAGRPVRFLAKAPLFSDPLVGWLVRGAGAIPVHRRQDDPAGMAQNADSFAAVFGALAAGAAAGIFPEGLSHDEPSLAPLRTGAARIALGTAAARGGEFPIVPIGLMFREKDVFRSHARVVIGRPVAWADLAAAGEENADAVRTLTQRIDRALRGVTVNLEAWEDAPLVEAADAIWAAEHGASPRTSDQVERFRLGTTRLAALRREGDPRWERTAREVLRHARLLGRLGLSPAGLHGDPGMRDAARWTLRRIVPAAAAVTVGALGAALFWPPYRLTGPLADALSPDRNVLATTKLLVGIPTYAAWLALLAGAAWIAVGPAVAAAVAVALPLFGVATLRLRERWRESRRDVRRFFLKRSRRRLIDELRARQARLAAEIAEHTAPPRPPAVPHGP